MSDEQIVHGLRSGDAAAIREARAAMFDKYGKGLLAYIRGRFRDIDATDVTQETFLAAWKDIDQLRVPKALGSWLYRIAERQGIAAAKKQGKADALAEDIPASGPTPDQKAETAAGIAILRKAVQTLSEPYRQMFWLLSQGIDGQELADVMAIKRGYAYKLKERLLKQLPAAQATLRLALYGPRHCQALAKGLEDSGWDGRDLTPRVTKWVEKHIVVCSGCRERWERFRDSAPVIFPPVPLDIPRPWEQLRDEVLVAAERQLPPLAAPTSTLSPRRVLSLRNQHPPSAVVRSVTQARLAPAGLPAGFTPALVVPIGGTVIVAGVVGLALWLKPANLASAPPGPSPTAGVVAPGTTASSSPGPGGESQSPPGPSERPRGVATAPGQQLPGVGPSAPGGTATAPGLGPAGDQPPGLLGSRPPTVIPTGPSRPPTGSPSTPPPPQVVPSCAGLPAGDCQAMLTAAGYATAQASELNPTVTCGSVVRTDPPAGSTAPRGSKVTMRVSAGSSGKVMASGLAGAIGSRYDPANNRLIFVEFASGKLSAVTLGCSPTYTTLGTGYGQPEDVVLARDGRTAYVTERTGNLLEVQLSNANRNAATLVASGLTVPHQIELDEGAGAAYTVEWADPGRLVKIDLATGVVTKVAAVHSGIGLLFSADRRVAYVTEQLPNGTGQLVRIDLASGQRQVLFTSATAPLFGMSWTDAARQAMYIPERDAGNKVWLVDVAGKSRLVADNLPPRPSSVTVVSPGRLLICSDSQIVQVSAG